MSERTYHEEFRDLMLEIESLRKEINDNMLVLFAQNLINSKISLEEELIPQGSIVLSPEITKATTNPLGII